MDSVRYCPPTRFDTAPYGTIVKVITERDGNQLWIQTSHDEPSWLRVGDMLEHGFENFFVQPAFVDMCLRLNDQAKGIQ